MMQDYYDLLYLEFTYYFRGFLGNMISYYQDYPKRKENGSQINKESDERWAWLGILRKKGYI